MGIAGLLPVLKSVTVSAHVSIYSGKKVAVDGYVWLHRGTFTCARELCEGRPTDKCERSTATQPLPALALASCPLATHSSPNFLLKRYVTYFLKNIEVLRSAGVIPVIVFVRCGPERIGRGCNLAAKESSLWELIRKPFLQQDGGRLPSKRGEEADRRKCAVGLSVVISDYFSI